MMLFPFPDTDFAPLAGFWKGAAEGTLQLPQCRACARFDWYPRGVCRQCGGTDIGWRTLSGDATLFSWAVVRRALHPPLAPLGPYISGIVTIAEDPRTRLVTRIIGAESDALRADMPMRVQFADAGYPALETGMVVPLFAPVER